MAKNGLNNGDEEDIVFVFNSKKDNENYLVNLEALLQDIGSNPTENGITSWSFSKWAAMQRRATKHTRRKGRLCVDRKTDWPLYCLIPLGTALYNLCTMRYVIETRRPPKILWQKNFLARCSMDAATYVKNCDAYKKWRNQHQTKRNYTFNRVAFCRFLCRFCMFARNNLPEESLPFGLRRAFYKLACSRATKDVMVKDVKTFIGEEIKHYSRAILTVFSDTSKCFSVGLLRKFKEHQGAQ